MEIAVIWFYRRKPREQSLETTFTASFPSLASVGLHPGALALKKYPHAWRHAGE
jgi:hypothetical protein